MGTSTLIVAAAAQTAQAASHGYFSLGLGLGVPLMEQLVFGISATRAVQRLREYLTVLRAVNDERTVDFHGAQITAVDPSVLPVALSGSTRFPIYVAAASTGPRTIEGFIAPTIAAAAAGAGRPSPRIIAMVSVGVTDEVDAVRAAAESLAMYDSIESYQKVLAREGVSSSVELAAIGTAEEVTRRLKTYFDAGATDLVLLPLETGVDDLKRVWDVAAGLA